MSLHRMLIAGLLAGTMFAGTPAKAEPVSTAIGLTAVISGLGVSTAAAGVIGGAIVSGVISAGASLIASAFSKPQSQAQSGTRGTQLNLQVGAAVPRSCIFGRSATAGHLIYVNAYGEENGGLDLVYRIGEGPHSALKGIIVDGKTCTLGEVTEFGYVVDEYVQEGIPCMYVSFTQGFEDQAADHYLIGHANPPERWTDAHRLAGICYVHVTLIYNETLFPGGIPSFVFDVEGRLCYDPRKDGTNGGVGSHRWGDPHTWEYSDNPAICLYNFQRGLYIGNELMLGQGVAPYDLMVDYTIAAANDCEEQVQLKAGGTENRYRLGLQVSADRQHRETIQDILDAMAGRLVEQVGAFGPLAGVAQVAAKTFSDADLIVGKPLKFSAKRSRSELINSIWGSYTDPAQSYQAVPYAPRTSVSDELSDGGERLATQLDLPQIQSQTTAQRLAEIARRRSRSQRTAIVTLGLAFLVMEPGDWMPWSSSASARTATYEVLNRVIDEDETVTLTLAETSASVYAWNHEVDELDPTNPGDVPGFATLATTVSGFGLHDVTLNGANGLKKPALKARWSPTSDRTITQVVIQYRIKEPGDTGEIKQVAFDRPTDGEGILAEGIQPATVYEGRATIITDPPRVTAWTEWVEEEAPPDEVVLTATNAWDVDEAAWNKRLSEYIDRLFAAIDFKIKPIEDMILLIETELDAAGFLDKQKVRAQVDAIRKAADAKLLETRTLLEAADGENRAAIEEVQSVAISTEGAVAELTTSVAAQFETANSSIETTQTALASLDNSFGNYVISTNATLGSLSSSVEVNALAIAGTNSSLASLTTTVSTMGATVTTISTAVGNLQGQVAAKWGVTLNVNGYVSGIESINGGTFSSFSVLADAFRVASPSLGAKPIFQVALVDGVPTLALRGDAFFDGSIAGRMLQAGSVNAINGAIANFAVEQFKIADNAVIVPIFATSGTAVGGTGQQNLCFASFTIDTRGLAGKRLHLWIDFSWGQNIAPGSGWSANIICNSVVLNFHAGAYQQVAMMMSGVFAFDANGGTMNFTVVGTWESNNPASNAQQGFLRIMTVKR